MKILVIKTSSLGDILHTFPAVQMIREMAPTASIDWIVEKSCAGLIESHPLVNHIHLIETKKWRQSFFAYWKEIKIAIHTIRKLEYDVVFDFQGNGKSGILMGLSRGKIKVGFGKKSVHELPNLLFSNCRFNSQPGVNIREDYLALVEGWSGEKGVIKNTLLNLSPLESEQLDRLSQRKSHGENVLVCPGSHWRNKRLSQESLIKILQKIEGERSCKFWIIQNSKEEKAFGEGLKSHLKECEITEALSLPLLQHFMKQMNLIVAMDSLPLHLAAEASVPTLSFFGPSLASKFAPHGEVHQSLQGTCPYHRTFTKRCPVLRTCPTGACMKNF